MGNILDFIQEQGGKKYQFYKTAKMSIDVPPSDTISYDDRQPSLDKKGTFAETDHRRIPTVLIDQSLIKLSSPIFSLFLDGSRHVYKVDDIAIGRKVFPVLAGQIVVGCCERAGRDNFHKVKVNHRIVLALPEDFDIDNENRQNNFCRSYCEKINVYLSHNRYFESANIKIDGILLYKTDGFAKDDTSAGKDKYKSQGIAKIQTSMTDEEQLLVAELCKNNKLDDEHFLIKDGSLEYTSRTNMESTIQKELQIINYKHIVGVSKLFNPELLSDYNGHSLAKTIASLKPYERTKVYRYHSEMINADTDYAVWYVRLRNSEFRETNFSDVVKCEMVLTKEGEKIESDVIDLISANIIKEAYPVCYGLDDRWANHLYPVYLTETFCSSHYLSNEIIFKMF